MQRNITRRAILIALLSEVAKLGFALAKIIFCGFIMYCIFFGIPSFATDFLGTALALIILLSVIVFAGMLLFNVARLLGSPRFLAKMIIFKGWFKNR